MTQRGRIRLFIDGVPLDDETRYRIDPAAAAWIKGEVWHRATMFAEEKERHCRALALERLRPRLRWLVDHPRLLRIVYRLAPSWRPSLALIRIPTPTTEPSAIMVGQRLLAEHRASNGEECARDVRRLRHVRPESLRRPRTGSVDPVTMTMPGSRPACRLVCRNRVRTDPRHPDHRLPCAACGSDRAGQRRGRCRPLDRRLHGP